MDTHAAALDSIVGTVEKIMIRKICCAALLSAAASVSAQTAPTPFSYTGFYDEEAATWLPDLVLGGGFIGTDNDGDGSITLPELRYFQFGSLSYYPGGNCGAAHCTLDSFTYTLAGNMSFETHYSYADGTDFFYSGSTQHCISGDRCVNTSFWVRGEDEGSVTTTLRWTEDTVFAISVPEPASGAMAGTGALLLGALHLRRRGWKSTQRPEIRTSGAAL